MAASDSGVSMAAGDNGANRAAGANGASRATGDNGAIPARCVVVGCQRGGQGEVSSRVDGRLLGWPRPLDSTGEFW